MKSSIATRFSAAAQTYHKLAAVQSRAAHRLMELTGHGQMPPRILEIGCGTGVLTALLSGAYPSAPIDAVDISAAMTAEARKNLADRKMINWITTDAREFSSALKYPLIASSCALHWIAPLEPVLLKLCALLEPGGRLAIAIMTRGTLAELHACRKRIAPHKPSPVILPAETDVRGAIAKAGLEIIADKQETIRHTYRSAKEMLRQLHDQGLTGANYPSANNRLTCPEILSLIEEYDANYRHNGGVYSSYRVFYCLATKEM